ncbi:hypothetical protein [Marinimicrobium sp. ABcell2]|uniref:hypothetical protein n=1 Tax=Marinimicrobium sp. ABcell2 TaxID=3069751 RepID=UPI0027B0831D|nr:hypothetical protein [Marinimicrobium sp. ABcell2]MDQ2078504.1 hypothetical protein [Marinimicrobium sp. ABcell2]
MKPIKTKRELRKELDQQMAEYVQAGGEVAEVAPGVSGREDPKGPLTPLFTPRTTIEGRTLVTEVVAAVEARRHPAPPKSKNKPKRQARKRVILDDFGQPLRWEWVEE